jgi:hypothetical protein
MQVTAFVALLALDAGRISERRCDALPCIRLPAHLMGESDGKDGQSGQDEQDREPLVGLNEQSGQSRQSGEPLEVESSGEVPVSTQGMYRGGSSGASPAGMSLQTSSSDRA